MARAFEIPLSPAPQSFPITLSGTLYTMTFQFRNAGPTGEGGSWVLDIADGFGNDMACGIPLVTGANLLSQFDYLGFVGQLWVLSDSNRAAVPTFVNLGVDSHVYWVVAQ